jgi:hypothetical protein
MAKLEQEVYMGDSKHDFDAGECETTHNKKEHERRED